MGGFFVWGWDALAGMVALSNPSPINVAIEASLLSSSDPEGLDYIVTTIAARKEALRASINAATSIMELEQITLGFSI